MLDIRLRAATGEDMAAVEGIYRHWVHASTATFDVTAPDQAHWCDRLTAIREASLPFLVAELDGAVAGYAYCAQWRAKPGYRHSVEDTIYLAPAAAGHGVGTALLRRLLADCARAGVREVVAVIADPGHPASGRLHERCGFRTVGRLSGIGYKHGQWLDTVLMQHSVA